MEKEVKYELNEAQQLLRTSIRDFVNQEIAPHAGRCDQEHHFPQEAIDKCSGMGLLGMIAPKEYGGEEMSSFDYAIVLEEIARGCASTAVILSVHNSLVTGTICKFGNEAQKKKYVPML